MTELNCFLNNLQKKEYHNFDEFLNPSLLEEPFTHRYYTYQYKIPISEINKNVCMCMEPKNYMMKASECKGNCKNNRPFFVLELNKPNIADMIDGFNSNIDFTVYLYTNIVNKENRILTCCSVFQDAYALIYLDQPNLPNEILFSKRLHMFPNEIRRNIINTMNPNGIVDKDFIYRYGTAKIV